MSASHYVQLFYFSDYYKSFRSSYISSIPNRAAHLFITQSGALHLLNKVNKKKKLK